MHRPNDFFDDRSRRTGDERGVFVLCFLFFRRDSEGGIAPHNDSASTSSRCSTLRSRLLQGVAFPQTILSILFVFLGLVALFFFLSGWVGFPLPRFPRSPLFLWRFLPLGGWVPLAAFSRCFPRASWVGWGAFSCFCVFLLSLASCIFSLLGLS